MPEIVVSRVDDLLDGYLDAYNRQRRRRSRRARR